MIDMNDKKLIFIIGSPRSGTTWLQLMIGAHPAVSTTVELTLFTKYIGSWIKFWEGEASNIDQGRWHKGLPVLWTEEEFHRFLREFLVRVYGRVVETNPQATHILDKNPSYALHIDLINRFCPNARFIHVIRDGRDVAVSMVAAKRQLGFGPATIQGAAEMWKNHVQAARTADKYHDRYMEVRYEELLADGATILKSVFDFCGLPARMEDVAEIVEAHEFEKMKAKKLTPAGDTEASDAHYRKGKAGSWREDLNPLQRYVLDQVAGDLLQDLGYAEGDWWVDSASQKVTLPARYAISTRKQALRSTARALLGSTLTGYVRSMRSKVR